jgi:geranylgeranyl diphosphate synthase type II
MGGIVGGGTSLECNALAEFGMELGLAFQIVDDILNETSTAQQLGKAAGSDRNRKKLTFPAAVGLDESRNRARELLETALERLCQLSGDTGPLREIAMSCVEREN